MSTRDKYSQDHTISINNGDGTLTVEGNLAVNRGFEVSTVELSSAITQTYRMLGHAFLARNTTDLSRVTFNLQGRAEFTSNEVTLHGPVVGLPHGAKINSLRVIGGAIGASDTLTISLFKSTGKNKDQLAQIILNNETVDSDESTTVDYTIDYSTNQNIFVAAKGISGTSDCHLDLVDIGYSIITFPQNSSTTPS